MASDIDIEKLPIDLHGIALANGLPSGITAHPAFKAFMREYKRAFAALVLEEEATKAESSVAEFGVNSEWTHGYVEGVKDCASGMRTFAEGLKP